VLQVGDIANRQVIGDDQPLSGDDPPKGQQHQQAQ
jgi:hypothetical protein